MKNDSDDQPLAHSEAPDDAADQCDPPGAGVLFPIVGVGASAGGLEALTQLLKALPVDTGMAFVLVQHLAPSHPSALAEILSRATKMPVMEVQDEPTVEPNHVYVIPPDRSMVIARGALQLLPREGGTLHRPVDEFFRSLAEEQRHQAIGVVLSGTATDGTLGLEAIKAEGGITFAQDATAQHGGMPHSAIASGCVDFVLPPHEIAREIVRIGQHPYAVPEAVARQTDEKPNLAGVVQMLHHATSVDFTGYKFNTLYRRVTRRMVLQKMDSLAEYVDYLRQTPAEAAVLYQDILIGVTSFFRDKESFEALKCQVFPRLLKGRSRHDPVRLWTLGCSTGQEAYSLAMAFTEAAEAAGSSVALQLFATDLNAAGIEKARTGIYPKDIAQDVSPDRLRRFFTEVDGGFRISKTIRDACIFSRHNVLADPPFSRIDLISCRNLLIYLEPVLQHRVMPTLHYALKPAGCLWLGASETIGSHRNLFDAEDAKHKIYAKKPGSSLGNGHFPLQPGAAPRVPFSPITARSSEAADLHREADRLLSVKFAPPGVLVSAELEILQYRGDTGPYLAPAPGKASLNLLKMLREGLLVGVRAAVLRAGKEEAPVREEGLRVKYSGRLHEVAVEVIPIKASGAREGGFLVLFDGQSQALQASRTASAPGDDASEGALRAQTQASSPLPDPDNARLTQELAATREFLQSVIEQQEAANEELQSANEEVQSANEELQSTNEELETSKEEIQSSNEELATVNDELNNRNAELDRVNNDLVNLLGSVQMAIVMVGPDLRVRRFTPTAGKLLNLIPADVGRPLADIKLNLDKLPDLEPLMAEVLETVSVKECEVQDKHGCWYSLRLRPYRTLDDKIDGVVVMLVDVDAMKRANDKVRESEAQYHAIFEATSVGVSETDPATGRLLRVNEQFARILGYTAAEVVGKTIVEITHPDDRPAHSENYSRLARGETACYEIEKRFVRKDGTILWAHVTVNLVRDAAGRPLRTVAITVDITERKRAQEALREQEERLRFVMDSMPQKIVTVKPSGETDYFSPQWTEFTGLSAEQIHGGGWKQLLHPDDLAETVRCWQHSIDTGEPFVHVHRLRDAHRAYRWHLSRMMPVPDAQGKVVMWICSCTDVHEQRQTTNQLRQYTEDLADADRRKNEFLAMLAHELRNPLAPLRNAVQVLRLTKGSGEAIQSGTAMMERQISQMAHLVDDLLDVSRISRGKIALRQERVDLVSVVNHAVEAAHPWCMDRKLDLKVTLASQPIFLNADPARLNQVVGNLLNNACKFSVEGGQIQLSVETDGGQAVIRVRDSGIGIAADQLSHIFEMFVQVDTSLERSVSGLGIGLTLAKRLVEMHGGTLEVFSAGMDQGSEFVARLPISADASDAPAPAPSPALGEKSPMTARRILVVDDNRDSATSLAELLKMTGHETHTAFDGLQAVEAAAAFRPDVVLLDIGLPKLNGYDACRRIRSQPWGKDIGIVALTGWGQADDRKNSEEAGFNGHMVKPVDYDALIKLLGELCPLGKKSASDSD